MKITLEIKPDEIYKHSLKDFLSLSNSDDKIKCKVQLDNQTGWRVITFNGEVLKCE